MKVVLEFCDVCLCEAPGELASLQMEHPKDVEPFTIPHLCAACRQAVREIIYSRINKQQHNLMNRKGYSVISWEDMPKEQG